MDREGDAEVKGQEYDRRVYRGVGDVHREAHKAGSSSSPDGRTSLRMSRATFEELFSNAPWESLSRSHDGSWLYRGIAIVEDEGVPRGEIKVVLTVEVTV